MQEAVILIVEDEEDLLEMLEYNLSREGFSTIGFLNTSRVEQALEEEDIDLILMDRNLPDMEGSEFINYLRKNGYDIPVVFLTAKDSDKDIEEGFLSGADDYITKPFKNKELIFRLKAILKRTKPSTLSKTLSYKDITLYLDARKVLVDTKEIELTKLEFDLLRIFIDNQNVVLNRELLLERVWGNDEQYQDRTVNVAINRLKEKIDPLKEKNYIKTVRGVGYTLA